MDSKHWDAADVIVSCYAAAAASNSQISKKQMSKHDYKLLDYRIIKVRRLFQMLIDTALLADKLSKESTDKRKTKSKGTRSRSASQSSQVSTLEGDEDVGQIDTDEFSRMINLELGLEEGSEEYEALAKGRKGKAVPKVNLANMKALPNVHIGLHLKYFAEMYGTLWNIAVLIGEEKHRAFKRHAPSTNHRGIELQLLQKVNIEQTIRFILDDAFVNSHPGITFVLNTLRNDCPNLFDRLLPFAC